MTRIISFKRQLFSQIMATTGGAFQGRLKASNSARNSTDRSELEIEESPKIRPKVGPSPKRMG